MLKRLAQEPAVITSVLDIDTVPPQLSVATTAALLAGISPAQLTVVFAGMLVITGAVWSLTVMVCVCEDALPHASVAV